MACALAVTHFGAGDLWGSCSQCRKVRKSAVMLILNRILELPNLVNLALRSFLADVGP